jgi:capsule polysaccharide export protein KpsE/RkpR
MRTPNLSAFAEKIEAIFKLYYTIEGQQKTTMETVSALKIEFAAMRTELLILKGQVSALEEARNTLRAEMERVKAETIAELRAIKAETVAELKVQQTRYEADLYRKFVDAEAAVRQKPTADPPPQIEK